MIANLVFSKYNNTKQMRFFFELPVFFVFFCPLFPFQALYHLVSEAADRKSDINYERFQRSDRGVYHAFR